MFLFEELKDSRIRSFVFIAANITCKSKKMKLNGLKTLLSYAHLGVGPHMINLPYTDCCSSFFESDKSYKTPR